MPFLMWQQSRLADFTARTFADVSVREHFSDPRLAEFMAGLDRRGLRASALGYRRATGADMADGVLAVLVARRLPRG